MASQLKKAGVNHRQYNRRRILPEKEVTSWTVSNQEFVKRDEEDNNRRRQRHADTKAQLSEDLADFLHLSKEQANKVKVYDEKDGLTLLHFLSENPDFELEHLRGLVLQSTDSKDWSNPAYEQVCKSFPYTKDVEAKEDTVLPENKILNAHWSEEGTVLRVFFANERWYISSHRLIDCTERRWSSERNFGELFDDCINRKELSSYLNKDFVYVFLLQHPENRIVSDFVNPRLLHVLTLKKDGGELVETETTVEHPNIGYPVKIETRDPKELLDLSRNPIEGKNGVIFQDENLRYFKFVNSEYMRKRLVRGNDPDISSRYISLTKLQNLEKANELLEMFPEQKEKIVSKEQDINTNLGHYLYDLYRTRFINKDRRVIPRDEYVLIKNVFDGVSRQVDGMFTQYSFSDLAELTRNEISKQICLSGVPRLLRMVDNMNALLSQ